MRAANTDPKLLKLLGLGAAAALLALAPKAAYAGKFKVLYSQCSEDTCAVGTGGSTGRLVEDAGGNFYGTTPDGFAFRLKRMDSGKFKYTALLSFNGGAPSGGMIIDTQGNLYGWAGQFYKMTYRHFAHHNRWDIQFPTLNCSTPPCAGTEPVGTLTYAGAASGTPWDGASPLYGVMSQGGANSGGTVYQLTPGDSGWTFAVLYNFCSQASCADGKEPAGVLLDQSGVLYGTTGHGGCSSSCNVNGGAGVAFELAPSGGNWTEMVLHTFCSLTNCADGSLPTGNLAQDAAGDLIGVTEFGGGRCKADISGCGVLYGLAPNGAQSHLTVLHAFCALRDCKDGHRPLATPSIDTTGNVIGTTEFGGGHDADRAGLGGGVAYKFASSLQVLHSFCSLGGCADGEYPEVGLTEDNTGTLYGTTGIGGAFDQGAVYQIIP